MEEINPLKNNFDNDLNKNRKSQLFEPIEEIDIINEKNELKLSLRKKHNNEIKAQKRKEQLKKSKLFIKENNSINYDELIKHLPQELIIEFTTTKNKYSFFMTYLNITEKDDPNFYIRMYTIYQISLMLNNDITNSSLPSDELLNSLLKYLVYEYQNKHINQKIQIQSEIIKILIICMSHIDIDNTNSILYDEQFIFFLFDMIDNNLYSIEFKINIFILFNSMIKGINTFNKIMIKFEIVNKIEKILTQINKDDLYIFVLKLISNIFDNLSDIENEDENNIYNNIAIFKDSYDKFIILLNHYYEQYQKLYEELKNNNTPISLDSKARIYYKIVILLLKLISKSFFINENKIYIKHIINSELSIPLLLKIMEIFSKEFFLNPNLMNNINMKINNDISLIANSSLKLNEKNNLYKKFKTITYITHILTELISSSDDKNIFPNFDKAYNILMNLIVKFNLINYYSNLIKNIVCFNIQPDLIFILRLEELIYDLCIIDENNYSLVYKNYELIKELLLLNIKYFSENNFSLLIKFIIHSIKLYETEITRCLIFDIKIISIFLKFLESEMKQKEKKIEIIEYILFALNCIIDSNTYRKCKLNRNLIIYEFNKNNANDILGNYALKLTDDGVYDLLNNILSNLDESDILDNNEIEELYNPSEF